MGQAGGRGRREVVTLSLVFILSYVSPGARKNPKHVPIGPHKCRQAAEGYPVSPRSERAVALTSWGSRPSLPNEYNVFILGTSDELETDLLPTALRLLPPHCPAKFIRTLISSCS